MKPMRQLASALVFTFAAAGVSAVAAQDKAAPKIDPIIDPSSGLIVDGDFEIVKGYCSACHSTKLITQAGKTREGWIESIRWMQKNHGLWDLGPTEPGVLDYLAKNYGVKQTTGRRKPIAPDLMPPPAPKS